jgi:hypothetical protein
MLLPGEKLSSGKSVPQNGNRGHAGTQRSLGNGHGPGFIAIETNNIITPCFTELQTADRTTRPERKAGTKSFCHQNPLKKFYPGRKKVLAREFFVKLFTRNIHADIKTTSRKDNHAQQRHKKLQNKNKKNLNQAPSSLKLYHFSTLYFFHDRHACAAQTRSNPTTTTRARLIVSTTAITTNALLVLMFTHFPPRELYTNFTRKTN